MSTGRQQSTESAPTAGPMTHPGRLCVSATVDAAHKKAPAGARAWYLLRNETVTFRVAPEKEPMTFVCIGRHYDFSEERKCTLHVELDLA